MSFVVVMLAILLRVAWVLLVPTKPVGDFAMYVESAAHLVEHGSFDPEYVYMPGYIFLIAPVQALGSGWLATKLVGAVLGGLGAGAVYGIARRLSNGSRSVALVASLLYTFWPAGIAIASVTGTDMPAAVLVVVAVYFLLRFAEARPMLAAILFGVFTGLAAYIRAIVVPLAALSVLVFRAQGNTWRASLRPTVLACLIAMLVLSPWALRNRLRYGETFFTDSHGGLTALVGANPNTDGCYSRSLNRMFRDVTGFALLAEPHREADRASLAIAKKWTTFDPLFTVGLLASKAERLLVHERALLYWPLFRAGVLPEPHRSFFARHRSAIESIADYYWLAVLALGLAGCGLAVARKQWLALSLLPQSGVLIALYTVIFSEPRYRLPLFMLLLPLSAIAIEWLWHTAHNLARKTPTPGWKREAIFAAGLASAVFMMGPSLAWAGSKLRENHRFAVHECRLSGRPQFCQWRTVGTEGDLAERPGVKGVWNGVGIALPNASGASSARITVETELLLAPGDYILSAALDISPVEQSILEGTLSFRANGQSLAPFVSLSVIAERSHQGQTIDWNTPVHHNGGPLNLSVQIEKQATPPDPPSSRLWINNLELRSGIAP
jgi:hypothetical protein